MIDFFRRLFRMIVHIEDCDIVDPEALRDLITLTGDSEAYGVTVAEIANWPLGDRRTVEEWAVAVHLAGFDHDDVEIPPVPYVICERHAAFVARRYEGG